MHSSAIVGRHTLCWCLHQVIPKVRRNEKKNAPDEPGHSVNQGHCILFGNGDLRYGVCMVFVA